MAKGCFLLPKVRTRQWAWAPSPLQALPRLGKGAQKPTIPLPTRSERFVVGATASCRSGVTETGVVRNRVRPTSPLGERHESHKCVRCPPSTHTRHGWWGWASERSVSALAPHISMNRLRGSPHSYGTPHPHIQHVSSACSALPCVAMCVRGEAEAGAATSAR